MSQGSETIMDTPHASVSELTSGTHTPAPGCRALSFHCYSTVGGTLTIDHLVAWEFRAIDSAVTVTQNELANVIVQYRMDSCRARFTPSSTAAGLTSIDVEES